MPAPAVADAVPLAHMPVELLSFIVGLCVGSFANVVIFRLPKGRSVISPPSHCPLCNTLLRFTDLIPIVSWFMLKGRCRYCNLPIKIRYPLIESACAILFVLTTRYLGSGVSLLTILPLWGLVFVLLTVSVIDLDTLTIPDELLLVGVVFAMLLHLVNNNPELSVMDAILGAIAGALPLFLIDRLVWLIAKKPGFGFGDVKLMAMSGLFIGWQGIQSAYIIAFAVGGMYGAWLMITGKAKRGAYIALGPFLCIGVFITLLKI